MNVLEIIDHEHALIGPVLNFAQSFARRMAQPGAAVEADGQALVGFFDSFVSQCHQAKEYELFVCLLRKQRANNIEPIIELHSEHSRLGPLTESLGAAWQMVHDGQAGARELLVGYLTDYVLLMQAHRQKEDHFYKTAQALLKAADHAELKVAFTKLDQETLGADGYTHYCQWAYQLACVQP